MPEDMPDTATGMLESFVAPFPSWPLPPLPQHLAAPDVVSAQVWAPPQEMGSLLEHSYPFPEKPGLQEQLKEPIVLTQDTLADTGQLCLFKMHSLISEQEKSFPEKPGLQPHETESNELEQTEFLSKSNAFKA